jgi:hypothetical protein
MENFEIGDKIIIVEANVYHGQYENRKGELIEIDEKSDNLKYHIRITDTFTLWCKRVKLIGSKPITKSQYKAAKKIIKAYKNQINGLKVGDSVVRKKEFDGICGGIVGGKIKEIIQDEQIILEGLPLIRLTKKNFKKA